MIQERLKRSNLILLLGAGVVVGLTLLRTHAWLWRAGGRGYIHQCYPRRAQKYRSQMIWLILGLMLGSLYAIANGPASLATPRPALSMATFQPVGFVLGATVLLALEDAKMMMKRKEQPGVPIVKGAKQA